MTGSGQRGGGAPCTADIVTAVSKEAGGQRPGGRAVDAGTPRPTTLTLLHMPSLVSGEPFTCPPGPLGLAPWPPHHPAFFPTRSQNPCPWRLGHVFVTPQFKYLFCHYLDHV